MDATRPVGPSILPLCLMAVLSVVAGCDDKAAPPPPAEEKSTPAQQLDEAKAQIDANQKAMEERNQAILDKANEQ